MIFFFHYFECYHTAFWPLWILFRSQNVVTEAPYTCWVTFLLCFQDSLFFEFDNDLSRSYLFEFILLEIYWVSWMCRLFFIKLGKFLTIISSNISSAPSLLFFWNFHYIYLYTTDVAPQISLTLVILLPCFFSLCSLGWMISTDLFSSILMILS